METKNKVIKMANVCYIVSKILYITSCIACGVFIVLAIVLSYTNAVENLSAAETASLFGTFALYSFMCIGLLWNVESLFKSVIQVKAPFGERVSHCLKKSAIFLVLLSLIPAIVGSTVVRLLVPATELVFPISFSGVVSGVVLFIFGLFFKYGNDLQKNDDETL